MYYRIFGLMLVVAFSGALMFPPGAYSQVTLAIGDGSGDPGSCATPVEVSLENSTVRVKGVSMDLCEPNDTLVRLGCDTTVANPCIYRGKRRLRLRHQRASQWLREGPFVFRPGQPD